MKKIKKQKRKSKIKLLTNNITKREIESFENGKNYMLYIIEELINQIERRCWDCNSPCGIVNSNVDKCKVCGAKKELSYDNARLEDLKEKIDRIKII